MKKLAQTFKALSDETRLRILALLTHGELCVCDLMAVLVLPQSTVSRHLAYLRNADMLLDQRKGVWMYYRLDDKFQTIESQPWKDLLNQFQKQEQAKRDHIELERYLAEKDAPGCG
jgi:ArsR family transcriptional regulator, arsenate/arsenite/antimonite-responsive transcriptional repressor